MGAMARVKAMGILGRKFKLSRGTRQECPLSPLLFVIYMEPFAQMIRRSRLKAYKWGWQDLKISLYADDILLTIASTEIWEKDLREITGVYRELAGYKIN